MGLIIDNGEGLPPTVPAAQVFHGGFVDYNDLATATTPIAVLGNGSDFQITNDTLGPFTNTAYLPDGVTSIWNSVTNQFDFSQLALGDMIDIRLELIPDIAGQNSEIEVDLQLGIGGNPYSIAFSRSSFKTSGVKGIDRFNGIYMGDSNTLNNPAQLVVRSDTALNLQVAGWYCKIIRRG